MINLYSQWIDAKKAEADAVKVRRAIEDLLIKEHKVSEAFEGTYNASTDGYRIRIVSRMNRRVDAEALREIAEEAGLTDLIDRLFRWVPEINASAWKSADKGITDTLLPAITTRPSRPSFTIETE